MRTKCPSCNRHLDDPHLIACPACHTVFSEYERTQLELLQQHGERLVAEAADRAWKRLRSRIGLCFAVIGGLTGLGLIPIYSGLSKLVINRIAAQFEEPRIIETLNQVAQTHASKIIENRISPAIEDAQRSIEQARQSLDNSLMDTKARFDLATDFNMTVVAAQSDDRKAFDKLKVLADDKSYAFSSLAESVWSSIFQERGRRLFMTGFTFPWREGLDSSKLTLEELRRGYEGISVYLKPALIEFIWKRDDFAKKDRMQFLVDVIENDQSLTAMEYAGRFFTEAAELKINPMAADYLVDWWKKNKDKFE